MSATVKRTLRRVAATLALAVLVLGANGIDARTIELAVSDMDAEDFACGLRYPAIRTRAEAALQAAKLRVVDASDYRLVLIVTSIKRETYCASDLVVALRRATWIADDEMFRTPDRRANLEFCHDGGLVASPIEEHARHFLDQVERSVRNCVAVLKY
jgi:hypothetical protein